MIRLFSYYRSGYTGKHYTKLYCFLMNLLDFRYWFCECECFAPYGRVISGDCKKHD